MCFECNRSTCGNQPFYEIIAVGIFFVLVTNLCFAGKFGGTEILGLRSFASASAVQYLALGSEGLQLVRCSILIAVTPPRIRVELQLVKRSKRSNFQ